MEKAQKEISRFFSLLYVPTKKEKFLLPLIPIFMIGVVWYHVESVRKENNPNDRAIPSVQQMYESTRDYLQRVDMRTQQSVFLQDCKSSFGVVVYGVAIASSVALVLGLCLGVMPWFRVMMIPIIVFLSNVIPPSITVILMSMFGSDYGFKIALICFGLTFLMCRDACNAVQALPQEQKIKTLTIGGGVFSYMIYIVLPQLMPRFLKTVQLYLGPAWVYVLTSEQITSSSGLAYRIGTVKRSFDVPLILSIVLLSTIVASLFSVAIGLVNRLAFPYFFHAKVTR